MRGDGDEIQRLERFDRAPCVGIGDQNIDAAGDQCAHRAGLARQHGLDDRGVVAGRLPAAWAGPEGKPVGADGALLGFEIEPELGPVQQFDVAGKPLRLARAQVAADAVDVAADGDEGMEGAERLYADARCVDAVPGNEGRGAVRVHARGRDDIGGGDPGQAGCDVGRVASGAFGQGIEAVAVVRHVIAIIKVVGDHDVDHGERQRCVGADARGEPEIGDGCRRRAFRIDDDQLGAALLGGLQGRPLDRIGNGGIAADDQRAACVLDVLAALDVEAGDAG